VNQKQLLFFVKFAKAVCNLSFSHSDRFYFCSAQNDSGSILFENFKLEFSSLVKYVYCFLHKGLQRYELIHFFIPLSLFFKNEILYRPDRKQNRSRANPKKDYLDCSFANRTAF